MDDLISRQAAIDLVSDVCNAVMSGCESRYDPVTEDEVYKDVLEVDAILKCNKEVRIALRNMPSAQPVRHGKWIKHMKVVHHENFDSYTPWWQCSECGQCYDATFANICNYCCYCGAKMDLERGEQDE